MANSQASLLGLTAALLAMLLVGFSATWGAFALWYRAPGGRALKTLSVVLWVGLSFTLLIALLQGRTVAGLLRHDWRAPASRFAYWSAGANF